MRVPLSPLSQPTAPPASVNDYLRRWPWSSFQLLRAREIWDRAPHHGHVVVAVIDDGFDLDHPALTDHLWQMPGRPDIHGWDFVDHDSDPSPATEVLVSSHGTMVAGIIGGGADPTAGFGGVAPNAELMLLRWRANQPREAHADPCRMAAALRFAVEHGARIVNLSAAIDGTGKSREALTELEQAFQLADRRNVLLVVAAPNIPWDMDTITDRLPGVYPFPNIIHVTGHCREGRVLGAWGARSVDIAAPAEGVIAPTPGGGYRAGSATSFAAPLVAGALVLVWGLLPNLRAEEVRKILLRNARSIRTEQELTDEWPDNAGPSSNNLSPNQSYERWGHEYPARPEGLLNLGFLEQAYELYWSGRAFPGFFLANAHAST